MGVLKYHGFEPKQVDFETALRWRSISSCNKTTKQSFQHGFMVINVINEAKGLLDHQVSMDWMTGNWRGE
jgi:hypothetical protein